MFLTFYLIYLDIKNLGIAEKKKFTKKKKVGMLNFANVFAKFFIFIISITAFMLLSTVALHEFGHAMLQPRFSERLFGVSRKHGSFFKAHAVALHESAGYVKNHVSGVGYHAVVVEYNCIDLHDIVPQENNL